MAKLYKNWTLQERYAGMLKAQGAVEVESSTGKYKVLRQADGSHIFLGKGGAVRICREGRPAVTRSIDVMKVYRTKLETYEKDNNLF